MESGHYVMKQDRPVIWFDFENAPQVLVLEPLIKRFQEDGFRTILTARKFSMTVELCRERGLDVHILGSGSRSGSRIAKISRVLQRALMLWRLPALRRIKPILGISHASRSQLIAGRLLGVPVVILDDYEHSDQTLARLANTIMVPACISEQIWGKFSKRVVHYPGVKENLYLCRFQASYELPVKIPNSKDKVIVLLRPEGRTAHYHSEKTAKLQGEIIELLSERGDVLVVVFPRDDHQKIEIEDMFSDGSAEIWFPEVTDGPNLIASSDLIIGGGGTMTREAAVLGIPSYSFFCGKWGSVDTHLVEEGRLIRIENSSDVSGIMLVKKDREAEVPGTGTFEFVYGHLLEVADGLRSEGGDVR